MPREVKRVLPTEKYKEGDVITFKHVDNGTVKEDISLIVTENSIKFTSNFSFSEEVYRFRAISKNTQLGHQLSIDYTSKENTLNITFTVLGDKKYSYYRIVREEDAISVDDVPYEHIFRIDNRIDYIYSSVPAYGYLSNAEGFIKFVSGSSELKRIN